MLLSRVLNTYVMFLLLCEAGASAVVEWCRFSQLFLHKQLRCDGVPRRFATGKHTSNLTTYRQRHHQEEGRRKTRATVAKLP